ncbi:amino acid adenylation domain-containing protein, partial [candidate division KSB3 bacterium]|nr:amino acid adenylation domain-containing protein [candidate division KSB3 bacterium]MBD3325489.1 amino acid adenylation domain-containing protein [candidate division KSB3 bacterium]
AFTLLLARYSRQKDIMVGSPIANRTRRETESLIGFFVNTLVLRTDLSGNPTFRELLSRVRQTTLEAYAHQDLPFEHLVEVVQPERNLSHSALFQTMFILQNTPQEKLELPGVTLTVLEPEACTAKFDLTLAIDETDSDLHGAIEYNTDLFDRETIRRVARHYAIILRSIVTNPQQRIADIPLLNDDEYHQLVTAWNATTVTYPDPFCLHQLFEAQVERTPDSVAVLDDKQSLTYAQLNARANQLARYLRTIGVEPDVCVGVCLERSVDMVVGLLGILKAGGAYIPLDKDAPQERLAFMLQDAQAAVVVTQQHLIAELPTGDAPILCLDTDWERISTERNTNLTVSTSPEHLAYVIYTSGSTGTPKGAMIPHRAICNHMRWMQEEFPLDPTDKVLQKTPYSFDASVWEFYAPLLAGARLIMARPGGHQESRYLVRVIAEYGVTILQLVPSLLQVLLDEDDFKHCTSLRRVFCGGEALSAALRDRFFAALNAELHNLYGPTEATIDTVFRTCQRDEPYQQTVPIGRPVANTQAYVLDPHLHPVPIGVPGELYLGGANLGRGYVNRPELTAGSFVPNPFHPGARLYKTGDLVRYLADGNIEFLGRVDFQVKVRGFRIEIEEVEIALRRHPAVQHAAVVAREDPGGNTRLIGYIIPAKEASPAPGELRQFLLAHLPEYMVPSLFVSLEAFPLTTSGKVNRRALPEPPEDWYAAEHAPAASRTPIEELLIGLWQQLLGVPQVGIHDQFFELGGHSLLATQLVSRIRDAFAVELPVRRVFERPTIAGLADLITAALQDDQPVAPPMSQVSREEHLPLSFAQERLWFLEQFEGQQAVYNIPAALKITGTLEIEDLQRSLNQIVRRHETLRTSFTDVDGKPVQVIAPAMDIPVPIVDVQSLSKEAQATEAQRIMAVEAARPFDLEQGSLLRILLIRLSQSEHLLLITMHHIITDGWSMGVFIRELALLFEAHSQGIPARLPDLPVQYADFAQWQREWLTGEPLERHMHYWRRQLAGAPPLLELPTDRPRPAVQTFHGKTEYFQLDTALTQALRTFSQQEGATLFMTLLAAFTLLLERYSHQEDIVVGTPIANRTRSEIEPLIGFFVNTLVLRTDLSGNPTFTDLLARVRQTTLDAYVHQDVPFEHVVDQLQPVRSLSYAPLFQVMLILQNTPVEPLTLPGMTLTPLETEGISAKFDLTLAFEETDAGLQGALEYNTDLFDRATICKFLAHFDNVLRSVTSYPHQPILSVSLLSEADRQHVVRDWNATEVEYPLDQCIHQLFEAQAANTPEAVAVVYREKTLTYRELDQRANQLARYLQQRGVGPEVLVGICLERSLEMMVGLVGILKAGGAYVPLDPEYPQERVAFMIEDSQISVVVTQQKFLTVIPEQTVTPICLDTDWEAIAQERSDPPLSDVTADNLMYVIYTSGSTGKPKGAMNIHRALCNRLLWMQEAYQLTEHDRVVQKTPCSFDVSGWEFFWPLITGARLVMAEPGGHKDSAYLVRMIRDQQITTMHFVPSMLQVFLEEPDVEHCTSLHRVICSGEALSYPLQERFFSRLKTAELHNLYGPTEAAIDVTFWHCLPASQRRIVPIGRPIANTQIYIVDAAFQPVPVGVPGELYIGGVNLARGYFARPELTAEKFVPNPFSQVPGSRLYATGDLARFLPDGTIDYLGRIDHQVKIRGFRVELGEIEATLARHPAIRETVVILREESPDDKRLVAYYVSDQEQELALPELRHFLRQHVPEYMIPAAFVRLDKMPLMPNGKLDRRALPIPELSRDDLQERYVAPRNPVEERLAEIWADILRIDRVGVYDNFFELGGHSLLAAQVIARIQKAFGVKLPLMNLFETPTIAHLADCVQLRLWAGQEGQSHAEPLHEDEEEFEL